MGQLSNNEVVSSVTDRDRRSSARPGRLDTCQPKVQPQIIDLRRCCQVRWVPRQDSKRELSSGRGDALAGERPQHWK